MKAISNTRVRLADRTEWHMVRVVGAEVVSFINTYYKKDSFVHGERAGRKIAAKFLWMSRQKLHLHCERIVSGANL